MTNYLTELQNALQGAVDRHGSRTEAAKELGISSAFFSQVLDKGKDSPKLRKMFGDIRKTDRIRICGDVSQTERDRFNRLRKGKACGDFIIAMMDLWEIYAIWDEDNDQ